MRKERRLPEIRDPYLQTIEYVDENTGLSMIDLKYGARDDLNQPIEVTDETDHALWRAIVDHDYYVVYYKRAPYEGGNIEIDERDRVNKVISNRNNLVSKSLELENNDNFRQTIRDYKALMNDWKNEDRLNIPFEQKLWNSFITPMNHFYERLEEYHNDNKSIKEDIISKAKELDALVDKNTNIIKDLQKQWKETGPANREDDNKLWDEFKSVCDDFFTAKKENYEKTVLPKFEEAKQKKEKLIEEAIQAASLEDLNEGTQAFKRLMVLWKEAGYAGHDDKKLWDDFNSHQQLFFMKKQSHYEKIHEELEAHYKAKRALINEASEIARKAEYDKEYSYERTNRMKEIQKEWKEIGSAGREHEQRLWNNLREVMDKYFDERNKYAIFNRFNNF